MLKSIALPAGAIALIAAASLLPHGGTALAEAPPLYVNAVDLEVAPSVTTKFLAALQQDGTAAMKEPGVREFDIAVSQKEPGHIFVFEVYDNAAAYDAHQKTAAYAKFIATTMAMIKAYNIRPFAAKAMNVNANAAAASGPVFINKVELDIAPAQFDAFMAAANTNGSASISDAGCRQFDIAVSQNEPQHVLFFEVYDNAAALQAQEATDRFKAYDAATKAMVTKRDTEPMSSVTMAAKGP